MKLEQIFKTLGFPLAVIAVISALLAWAGLSLDEILRIDATLVGFQLLGFVLVDALKYAGVVQPGDSGKWSAVYNLITLIGIAVWLGFFPEFDLVSFDAKIYQFAELLGLILAYVAQITGTKGFHIVAVNKKLTYSFPEY